MKRRIGSLSQSPNITIDCYPLFFAYNVTSIEVTAEKDEMFGWDIYENENHVQSQENAYLYIDGYRDDPFGHWVFECAIHLPVFFHLREIYPSLKLLSYNRKKYKDIFYKGFGLQKEDIVNEAKPENNMIIFPQWNSLGDHAIPSCAHYLEQSRVFYRSLVDTSMPTSKSINLLYLPRGTKENFKANDRVIPAQKGLLELITKIIPSTVIYDTDTTKNIKDQIQLVRSSTIILLDYGSSLLVNGYFAENAFLFVLGDFGHIHCKNPKPYGLLEETVTRGTKYCYIPVHWDAHDIVKVIVDALQRGFQQYEHRYTCWRHLEGHSCSHCDSRIALSS